MANCIFNTNSNRFLAICQLLSQDPYVHPEIQFSVAGHHGGISITHRTWGPLATLAVSSLPASQTYLVTKFPEFPDEAETREYQIALLLELTPQQPELRRLADPIYGNNKYLLSRLANELFMIRSDHRGYALKWLVDGLKIWGIEMLNQPETTPATKVSRGSFWHLWGNKTKRISEPRAAFDLVIKGQPAEFAIMARESILKEIGMYCSLGKPGSQKEIFDFSPDINPISVQFKAEEYSLSLVAHKLPNENTLLKVSISDCEKGWLAWYAFRDNLERLGWITISNFEAVNPSMVPEVQGPSTINLSNSISQVDKPDKETSQIWLTIPDKGWDRECVRLWHRGLTCKDIGVRLQKTDKTILNRLNQLRKEFGEQTVPYRNANYRSG